MTSPSLVPQRTSGWRRIAGALWSHPTDPQIYGWFELDATAALRFIDRARALGHPLTLTHLVGRAGAHALREVPEVNVYLRGGRTVPKPSVEVFFITAVGGGHDLSGVKVVDADRKTALEVAREVSSTARDLRRGADANFERTKRLTNRLPRLVLRGLLRVLAYLAGERGWRLDALGLPARPFGSMMVSSVGMFGIPFGLSPIAWMYRVPVLILAGVVEPKPVVVDGKIEARPVLPITATIDHRYVDGWHLSKLLLAFREYLENPERFEPALTAQPQPSLTGEPAPPEARKH